ncbi:MAG: FAD:protein FMN transferase, partial [Pseudomonadota bacterium]
PMGAPGYGPASRPADAAGVRGAGGMSLDRRRFLCVAAAFAAAPRAAHAARWTGRAFGAPARIEIRGPRAAADAALDDAVAALRAVETAFSIYDPNGFLARLNAAGAARIESPLIEPLFDRIDTLYVATDGLFDPTIQALWRAYRDDGDVDAARAALGWTRLRRDGAGVALAPGQALSFNGIAQGFGADQVAAVLRVAGAAETLIDVGEQVALGGPFRLGIVDPVHGHIGGRTLADGAVATSSPQATLLRGRPHILHPRDAGAAPRWSTVSVEADDAASADALSTALCLADLDHAERILARVRGARRALFVDQAGDVREIRA